MLLGLNFIMVDYAFKNMSETKETYYPMIGLIVSLITFPITFPIMIFFYFMFLLILISKKNLEDTWEVVNSLIDKSDKENKNE